MGTVEPTRQRRLLVLGAGSAQLGLLEAARRCGLCVIAVDGDASAPGFRLADRRALVAADDEAAVHRLAEAEEIDGVVGGNPDSTVGIAARVAARLGLAHPLAPATAALATSRLKQRQRLLEAGVPHVPWRLATDVHADVRVPCVVKPSDRGGLGLSVVRKPSELRPAIRAAIEASRSRTAIVEELVEGPEVIVHGFSAQGRFHELLAVDRSNVGELAAAAAAALGIETGPTQTEIRLGPDGPRVAEVAATHEAELWREAEPDVNLLVVRACLGERLDDADLVPFGAAHAGRPNPLEAAA
jgi:biotin carboxylase